MAYDLYIERFPNGVDAERVPISLEEWNAAISATKGVRRIASNVHSMINPKTGETIQISGRDGDAEVYFAATTVGFPVFRWLGECASFPARFDLDNASNLGWQAAVELANRLGAVIRGDNGEQYEF